MIGKFRKLSALDFFVIKHLSATSIFNTIQNPMVSGTPSMYEYHSVFLLHSVAVPHSLTFSTYLIV